MRLRDTIIAMIPIVLYGACSTPNADAPEAGRVHTKASIATHGPEAAISPDPCKICHSPALTGGGTVTSCFACHEEGPPFTRHSLPYISPEAHGPDAADTMRTCQNCHGSLPNLFTGGIVADPDIYNTPSATCAATTCHPAAGAHPTNWQGTNDTTIDYLSTHRTAKNQDINCVICHDFTQGREAPEPRAPSCFSAGFTNADGATTECHPGGAGAADHPLPYTQPQDHGSAARDTMDQCQRCHGTPGTLLFTGGIASTSCAAAECHPAAGAHPTRWQGENDITPDYRSTHQEANNLNTTCVICHDVTLGHPRPHPTAPSCFSSGFTNSDGSTTECHDEGP
ncbi:hypothetical protein DSLASN_07940 [Desulfoluna limicola]|uniref:Uncharacterized protein n=1 Tax=Desulfoluna limicola TaxID=2810562 RepID=A0ABM7PD49_9BACT|nr:hypothetical protein [Desulfoluna limicola]BCS95162.1 hypothetical protein DSLASN_07940 [Desulfoluna limicola]